MKRIFKAIAKGVAVAAVLAGAAGIAYSFNTGTVTFKGAVSPLIDSGVVQHSDAIATPSAGTLGICCQPSIPAALGAGANYDSVQLAITCSNDGTNWSICPGIADAGYSVTDAGPAGQASGPQWVACFNVSPLPFPYIAVSANVTGSSNFGNLSCTTSRP